jgi:hypothetical protein
MSAPFVSLETARLLLRAPLASASHEGASRASGQDSAQDGYFLVARTLFAFRTDASCPLRRRGARNALSAPALKLPELEGAEPESARLAAVFSGVSGGKNVVFPRAVAGAQHFSRRAGRTRESGQLFIKEIRLASGKRKARREAGLPLIGQGDSAKVGRPLRSEIAPAFRSGALSIARTAPFER